MAAAPLNSPGVHYHTYARRTHATQHAHTPPTYYFPLLAACPLPQVSQLPVPAGSEEVFFCKSFEVTADLKDFVGRILTVHSGPTCVAAAAAAAASLDVQKAQAVSIAAPPCCHLFRAGRPGCQVALAALRSPTQFFSPPSRVARVRACMYLHLRLCVCACVRVCVCACACVLRAPLMRMRRRRRSSSPTVASGVCGLAHPDAAVSCSADDVDGAAAAAAAAAWSIVAVAVAAAAAAIAAAVPGH